MKWRARSLGATLVLSAVTAGCPGIFELTRGGEPALSDGGPSEDASQTGPLFRCGPRPTVPRPPSGTPVRRVGNGSRASCTEAALRDAVAQGGVIDLDCGSGLVEIQLTSPLALGAAPVYLDGEGRITLSGGGEVPVLLLASRPPEVVLERISLSRGSADSGGAVRVPAGVRLWLSEVVFTSNTSTGPTDPGSVPAVGGGALHVRPGGEVVAVATNFLNNEASFGGAVFVEGRAHLHGVRFRSNLAAAEGLRSGGALAAVDGEVVVCDAVFEDNRAGRGGAVFVRGTQLQVTGSRFDQNLALGGDARLRAIGGAVAAVSSTSELHRVSLQGNLALQGGGGIALEGGTGRLVNISMLDNQVSSGPGGAALFTGGEHSVLHGTFANNAATDAGSAVAGEATVTLTNTLLTGEASLCGATYEGGFVLQSGGLPCVATASTLPDLGLPSTPTRCNLLDALIPRDDSPARGAGNPSLCSEQDLCGRLRDTSCDLGAVETDS